jgi:3-oxoacyl-[acyl-carrier protein] reductase
MLSRNPDSMFMAAETFGPFHVGSSAKGNSRRGVISSMRTVLVTGATGGIGLPLCRKLSAAGYSLILAARDEAKLAALCDELSKSPSATHSWVSLDMAKDASIEAFSGELASRAVVLDGIVLMPPPLPRSNDPLPSNDVWREAFQNCFIGPAAVLKVAIARMQPDTGQNRRAKIVIISAISSAQVLTNYALSNAIRAAWVGQAKTVAFAFGNRGIHINTLSLGGIMTPGYTALIEKRAADAGIALADRLAAETSNVPLGKYGAPEEVAAAIEGLLSAFSDHITGANIMCDGGFTRAY